MNKGMTLEPTADEAAEVREAIGRLLFKVKQANEQMEDDQREIDELKTQTRAILKKLKVA